MALLRNLEHSLSGLVEGTVGRVFRTEVRPTEIARKLAREMEINKRVSLSRTYAPTDYLVYLSAADRARYTGVEESIADELGAYLLEHARRERLVLVRRPLVVFRTDERLRLGEFGIEARTAPISVEEAPPRPERSAPPIPADPGDAPVRVRPQPPVDAQPEPEPELEPEPEPAHAPAAVEPEPQAFVDDSELFAHEPPHADPFDDPFDEEADYLAIDDHAGHAAAVDHAHDDEQGPDWLDPIDDWDPVDPAPAAVPWIDPALQPRAGVQPPPIRELEPTAPAAPPEPVQPIAPAAPQLPVLSLLVDGVPHQITTDGASIGRSRSCDIQVADPSVSRRHVELRCDEHGWFVTDLGSTNGSTLDGAPLTGSQRLAPGQRLALGHATAVIEVR